MRTSKKTLYITLGFVGINVILMWVAFFIKGNCPNEFYIATIPPVLTELILSFLAGTKGDKNDKVG